MGTPRSSQSSHKGSGGERRVSQSEHNLLVALCSQLPSGSNSPIIRPTGLVVPFHQTLGDLYNNYKIFISSVASPFDLSGSTFRAYVGIKMKWELATDPQSRQHSSTQRRQCQSVEELVLQTSPTLSPSLSEQFTEQKCWHYWRRSVSLFVIKMFRRADRNISDFIWKCLIRLAAVAQSPVISSTGSRWRSFIEIETKLWDAWWRGLDLVSTADTRWSEWP